MLEERGLPPDQLERARHLLQQAAVDPAGSSGEQRWIYRGPGMKQARSPRELVDTIVEAVRSESAPSSSQQASPPPVPPHLRPGVLTAKLDGGQTITVPLSHLRAPTLEQMLRPQGLAQAEDDSLVSSGGGGGKRRRAVTATPADFPTRFATQVLGLASERDEALRQVAELQRQVVEAQRREAERTSERDKAQREAAHHREVVGGIDQHWGITNDMHGFAKRLSEEADREAVAKELVRWWQQLSAADQTVTLGVGRAAGEAASELRAPDAGLRHVRRAADKLRKAPCPFVGFLWRVVWNAVSP